MKKEKAYGPFVSLHLQVRKPDISSFLLRRPPSSLRPSLSHHTSQSTSSWLARRRFLVGLSLARTASLTRPLTTVIFPPRDLREERSRREERKTSAARSTPFVESCCSIPVRPPPSHAVRRQHDDPCPTRLLHPALYTIVVTPICVVRMYTGTHDLFKAANFPWGVIVFASTVEALSGLFNVGRLRSPPPPSHVRKLD